MILGYGELSFAEVLFRFRRQNIRDLKSVFYLCQLSSLTHILDSSHKCNRLMLKEYLKRGSKSKAFSGPMIEFVSCRNRFSSGNL